MSFNAVVLNGRKLYVNLQSGEFIIRPDESYSTPTEEEKAFVLAHNPFWIDPDTERACKFLRYYPRKETREEAIIRCLRECADELEKARKNWVALGSPQFQMEVSSSLVGPWCAASKHSKPTEKQEALNSIYEALGEEPFPYF